MNRKVEVVVAGNVDDGKSTLIGRLLYELDSFTDGKLEYLKKISEKRSMRLEWSFVLDAFQAERNQAITIDTSKTHLKMLNGTIVIIDAPGHIEFLKNMISGAAGADAGVIIIDVTQGVTDQTKRHAYILHMLGIRQITVLVNKMDLIDYSAHGYYQVIDQIHDYLLEIGISATHYIPISAYFGDSLTEHSKNMPWYDGPTVVEVLSSFIQLDSYNDEYLRIPIQDVYKFDQRRIIAGRIVNGTLRTGDTLFFSPSNQIAQVKSIESWNSEEKKYAKSGESIGIILDKKIFVERGEIVSHLSNRPTQTNTFKARIFWLGNKSLKQGQQYTMKLATQQVSITILSIECKIDINTIAKQKTKTLQKNDCAEITIYSNKLIPIDEYDISPSTGRFILVDGCEIVAGGMIFKQILKTDISLKHIISDTNHLVTLSQRMLRNEHKSGILWFTGLSGAGKSTLAMNIERALFQIGYQVYTLDGDNIRNRLNSNLGFSPEDRMENIRRIGEVAALFVNAGFLCITASISPYRAERNRARKMVPEGFFHEIYIKSTLDVCECRDTKGLYKKARQVEILDFTGISSPYEEPINPELIIDTEANNIETCVNKIIEYVIKNFSKIQASNYTDKDNQMQENLVDIN